METTAIYALIGLFALVTIVLIWFGAKFLLDVHHRRKRRRNPRNTPQS